MESSLAVHTIIGVRGLPARGYFIPGRDGAGVRRLGIVPCRRRVSSSRDRVGMRRAGVRARHTSPDKETSTRRGNKHSTRKQGNKHPTRKQALNKERNTQKGNRHSTRKQALISRYVILCCTCWTLISCNFLICSKCWTVMYYTHVYISATVPQARSGVFLGPSTVMTVGQ